MVEPLVCWEDEVLRRHLAGWWRAAGAWWSRRGGIGAGALLRWSADCAQARAERAQARRRLGVLRRDKWLDENLGIQSGAGAAGIPIRKRARRARGAPDRRRQSYPLP